MPPQALRPSLVTLGLLAALPWGFASAAEDAVLAAELGQELGQERFARCQDEMNVVLNEVCAVGAECDEDVRVADFVEVYNPGAAAVDLSCFVLRARDGETFLARGMLPPRGVAAWGEGELGFRIAKHDDEVRLHRLGLDAAGQPTLLEIDTVRVVKGRAHWFRLPDGGAWRHRAVAEAESEWRTSFGRSNRENGKASD